ncbi:transposase, MuDR, plant [Tanacetum coccineum]
MMKTYDEHLAKCVELGAQNDNVLDIYVSHSVFDFFDATSCSKQQVGNAEHNDDSDLDDVYVYDSESEESETASVDHLSDGEEEVYDARTRKPDIAPKKNLMRPVLGEKYESPEQLKRALVFYALANGYKLYYEVNNPRRLLAKYCRDDKDNKCPFRNYAKKIMMNPCIKVKEIIESILKKYKCKVKISQARRGKMKALQQYETCLEDHYGMLWSYASEILNSNPFNMVKGGGEGWLQGCRRVIGLDGCFLKTICKGELLSAVGRDGINQILSIAWVVVSVENKDNWSWFMELLINDLGLVSGEGLTIISDQHKGIIEAAKQVMPLAEHRQCARHIYANFRKKYTGVQYRNLFWDAERKPRSHRFNRFEVRNGYEGFKVDERSRSCSCRGWQLSGIPCEHGMAAIYFLHKDPKNYVFDWYNKDVFVNAYNHYIEGMNGMDQWPTTDYQKPLPPVVRRMPGRPPHKKRDVMEDDGNRTRVK